MGPMFEDLTFDSWLAEIQRLLFLIASWMLREPAGRYVLLAVLILLVLWAVVTIHGNVKADDSFNIRSDAKAMADWYKERV